MGSIFFGKPFKVFILTILIVSIGLINYGVTDNKSNDSGESKLSLDMKSGGAELFREISSSMIQITSGSGSMGSGYIIDKEGHAITNAHVVGDSPVVSVAFFGDESTGARHKGIVKGLDLTLDLAVIKVETDIKNIHPVKFGNSDDVRAGDIIAACGSPGRESELKIVRDVTDRLDFFTFTLGSVIEILDFQRSWSRACFNNRYYGSGVQYLFHVSALMNPGNSGGPCINDHGEVIGSNTWKIMATRGGFSVPSNLLKRSAEDIIKHGRPMTPWCGILLHPTELPSHRQFVETPVSLLDEIWFDPAPDNITVQYLNPNSPAGKSGLRKGDIILSLDNNKFSNVFDIYAYILNCTVGQDVTFSVRRNRSDIPPITVKLGEKRIRYDINKPNQSALTY